METFKFYGFEFEATATYEGPEPGNFMQGGYEIEIEEIRITSVFEIIQAYGIKEAFAMGQDLGEWIIENESSNIIETCNERQ